MLVLSRKKDETIRLGNDIEIKVVRVSGNRVRLAIDAPPDVKVLRGELQDEPIADDPPIEISYTISDNLVSRV